MKQKRKPGFWMGLFMAVILISIFVGLHVRYRELSYISLFIMTSCSAALLFYAHYRRTEEFFLAFLTGSALYIALINSFGKPNIGDSPLSLDIVLGPWALFFITVFSVWGILHWYERSRQENKFALILLVTYIVVWIILSTNVLFFHDWWLENLLTVPFILLLYFMHRWFKFSNISYGLIFAYMVLHIIGTHYTYSEVPFGFWLSELFGLTRNHYDRIVHFSFGFLLAYPLREVFFRIGKGKGFWGFYIPVEFVLAFSAIYELIEWGIAIIFGGDLGVAYLGTQGDPWDAQKDIALAGLGSLITMSIVALIHLRHKGMAFFKEIQDSFKIAKKPLGETTLEEWSHERR